MANTVNRGYPRPDDTRDIADEFPVSDQALVAIDADVKALFNAILGLASLGHVHTIADVTGLQTALDGKSASGHVHTFDDLSDVSGMAGAADGYLPVKSGSGWVPASPASVLGSHGHPISDITGLEAALDGKVPSTWISTAANYLAKVTNKVLTAVAVWDAAVPVVVPYSGSVAIDFATLINAKITLTGNLTLAAPTNVKPGQSGLIRLIQDATGARTVSFHSDWKFAGGTDPTASTAANAVDYLYYHCAEASVIHASLVKAVS